MQCIVEICGRVWIQADPELIVSRVLQSLENWNIYSFWIVHVVLWLPVCMYIQSTGKVFRRKCNLFAENVIPNGLADVVRTFPHFQKIWKCSIVVYLQVKYYI